MLGGANHFWQPDPLSQDLSVAMTNVKAFFSSMLRVFAGQENKVRFLLGNVGLRIIFRTVQVLERNNRVMEFAIDKTDFLDDLRKILDDQLISELQTLYGAGGKVEGSKRIVKGLKSKFPKKYGTLEMDFRRLPDAVHLNLLP